MSALASLAERITLIQTSSQSSKRAEGSGWLAVEIRMYELNLDILSWLEHPDRDSPSHAARIRDRYSVSIMHKLKNIAMNGGIFHAAGRALESVLIALGFATLVASLIHSSSNVRPDDKRELHFDFVKLLKSKSMTPIYPFMQIIEDLTLWQLRNFGEFMDRSMDSQPDSRVYFEPDAWQRQVLDCLDEPGHSVLVVGVCCIT